MLSAIATHPSVVPPSSHVGGVRPPAETEPDNSEQVPGHDGSGLATE